MGRALRPGLGAASLPPAPARNVGPYLAGKRGAFHPRGMQGIPVYRGRSEPVPGPARFHRQLRPEGGRRPRDLHTPSEPPRTVAGGLSPIAEPVAPISFRQGVPTARPPGMGSLRAPVCLGQPDGGTCGVVVFGRGPHHDEGGPEDGPLSGGPRDPMGRPGPCGHPLRKEGPEPRDVARGRRAPGRGYDQAVDP